jgi:hypothetical protein
MKHQIPNTKFQISTNDQNPKPNRLGHLKFEIEIYLEFGIWLLEFHPRMDYA